MSHQHTRPASRESQPPLGPASLLDIGGDVGAVVVRLHADTASGELLACPQGDPAAHFHTGVHLRATEDGPGWVAVFPEVVNGAYSLLSDGVEHTRFEVSGGEVTFLDVRHGTASATASS